jgi:hypothetical protein
MPFLEMQGFLRATTAGKSLPEPFLIFIVKNRNTEKKKPEAQRRKNR